MNDMHRQVDDEQSQSPASERHNIVIFDRKIPVTFALSAVAAFAGFQIAMYYQQDQTSKKVLEVATDVKQIGKDLTAQQNKAQEDNFTLRDLSRRMTAAEMKLETMQSQKVGK